MSVMPIRDEELRRLSARRAEHGKAGAAIAQDRKCRGCSYNLRGLMDTGNCPECGRPIRKTYVAQFADQMTSAPAAWVGRYRLGTKLLCFGAWLMAFGLLAWGVFGQIALVAGAFVGSLAWVAGTFITTRPRPRTLRMEVDPTREWRRWRAWARVSQPGWLIGLAGLLAIQANGWYTPQAIAPVSICILVGIVGWWPLMLMQSNLAYWASDSELADRLRNCSWASALGMGIGAAMVGIVGGLNGGLPDRFVVLGYFASGLVLGVWVLLGVFSLWYTLSTLWQLARLGVWVTLAQTNVAMRDERLREQVARAAHGVDEARETADRRPLHVTSGRA
jgi:hypothetical protein